MTCAQRVGGDEGWGKGGGGGGGWLGGLGEGCLGGWPERQLQCDLAPGTAGAKRSPCPTPLAPASAAASILTPNPTHPHPHLRLRQRLPVLVVANQPEPRHLRKQAAAEPAASEGSIKDEKQSAQQQTHSPASFL